jgi:hypothetical protein
MKTTVERIRGRVVEIEVGEAKGLGWVAVGIVKTGLDRLRAEIEAQLA